MRDHKLVEYGGVSNLKSNIFLHANMDLLGGRARVPALGGSVTLWLCSLVSPSSYWMSVRSCYFEKYDHCRISTMDIVCPHRGAQIIPLLKNRGILGEVVCPPPVGACRNSFFSFF